MHAQLLAKNHWDSIAQEILISTPRRFGKTISKIACCARGVRPRNSRASHTGVSMFCARGVRRRNSNAFRTGVSMFCAALLLSCPAVEISIYSTCKRISQKILRNVMKFAMMIADQDLGEFCARHSLALDYTCLPLTLIRNSEHPLPNQKRKHGRDIP